MHKKGFYHPVVTRKVLRWEKGVVLVYFGRNIDEPPKLPPGEPVYTLVDIKLQLSLLQAWNQFLFSGCLGREGKGEKGWAQISISVNQAECRNWNESKDNREMATRKGKRRERRAVPWGRRDEAQVRANLFLPNCRPGGSIHHLLRMLRRKDENEEKKKRRRKWKMNPRGRQSGSRGGTGRWAI